MAVWCSEFGTKVFEGKTRQTMHNHLVNGQMSMSLLKSWRDEMLQTFPFPEASSQRWIPLPRLQQQSKHGLK
jgi:hypothetical protein